MNVEECLNKGLLKKTSGSVEQANASIRMAEHKLELAEKEFESGIYENVIITAYSAMFHAGRALLFKDGYKERSHYALYVYLDEGYSGKLERKYLNEFNSMRLARHDLMYGLDARSETKEIEAKSAIAVAEGFLKSVKGLVSEDK